VLPNPINTKAAWNQFAEYQAALLLTPASAGIDRLFFNNS
jgi:hypothetical protein